MFAAEVGIHSVCARMVIGTDWGAYMHDVAGASTMPAGRIRAGFPTQSGSDTALLSPGPLVLT
jgi:hypothetical protein